MKGQDYYVRLGRKKGREEVLKKIDKQMRGIKSEIPHAPPKAVRAFELVLTAFASNFQEPDWFPFDWQKYYNMDEAYEFDCKKCGNSIEHNELEKHTEKCGKLKGDAEK